MYKRRAMKKRNIKITGIVILLFLLLGTAIVYQMYNKPHRSIESETALIISAENLALSYSKNEASADKKYLDKPIQVTGLIADIANNQQNKQVVVLQGTDLSGVQCTLEQNNNALKKGANVIIKGFCTGYLTDVILDRCVVVEIK